MKRLSVYLCAIAAPLALAACEAGEETAATHPAADDTGSMVLDNGMSVRATIETRQENLKEMGAAMKTISDQLKLEAPDVDAIYASAQTIEGHSMNIGDWFPAGTGPDSGIETEALANIWESPDDFANAVARFQNEADGFEAVAVTRNVDDIRAGLPSLGGACKNCHDQFRLDTN